jgi:hypothetical protein
VGGVVLLLLLLALLLAALGLRLLLLGALRATTSTGRSAQVLSTALCCVALPQAAGLR